MKLIKNWKELSEVPDSPTHRLEITPEDGSGWLVPNDDLFKSRYLSTHTFYGSTYKWSTELLQSCGFNIQLASWDE